MTTVTKAVIPAAGWGTRFLPFAKSVPKEMLPIIDRPPSSTSSRRRWPQGSTTSLPSSAPTRRPSRTTSTGPKSSRRCSRRAARTTCLAEVRNLADLVELHSVRQGEALGLGHAVGMARKHVGDNAFAVLLGDDMMHPDSPLLRNMIAATERTGRSTIALMRVPKEDISLYGSASVEPIDGRSPWSRSPAWSRSRRSTRRRRTWR
jgi:UTP--glucose-1-phosphate uridylyltransferase